MKTTDFQPNKTYLIRQQPGSTAAGAGEIYVIETLTQVSVASAQVYQERQYVQATMAQIQSYEQFLRVTRRSSRKVFFLDPETIVNAVPLPD